MFLGGAWPALKRPWRKLVLVCYALRMADIKYQFYTGFPEDQVLQDIAFVSQSVFPGVTIEKAEQLNRDKLEGRKAIFIIVAKEDGKPVGFKQGYATRPGFFESESGGVVESARKRGIANEMIKLQHEWCVKNKFVFIDTSVSNDNQTMLILNLKHGFKVVGTTLHRNKIPLVLLQKQIAEM